MDWRAIYIPTYVNVNGAFDADTPSSMTKTKYINTYITCSSVMHSDQRGIFILLHAAPNIQSKLSY